MRQQAPAFLHPLLFAIWPVLFLYSECTDAVPFFRIFRPALVALGGTALLLLIVSRGSKDVERRAIALSFLLLWFASYGYIRFTLPVRTLYLLPAYFLALLVFLLWLSRTRADIGLLTRAVNAAAVVLVLFALLRIGVHWVRLVRDSQSSDNEAPTQAKQNLSMPLGYLPDIYYIILDSYTRSDVLRKRYGEDNSYFINELQRRGFYVAKKSHSNYPVTWLSVGSCLNMCYLSDLGCKHPSPVISGNRVCSRLRQLGYTTVALPSCYELLDYFPADVSIRGTATFSAFEGALLQTTLWSGLEVCMKAAGVQFRPNTIRQTTLFTLDQLPKVRSLVRSGPIFVFAHVMPPHWPFVFGRRGEDVSASSDLGLRATYEGSRESFGKGYSAQVAFISTRMLSVIDGILSNSPKRPVIIIQGDHGPRAELRWLEPGSVIWEDVYPILNAYYLPQKGRARLYDSITPVNTFRVVFNHCFGTQYELLEDASFFATPAKPCESIRVEPPADGDSAH